ncbi:hypothetical protein FRACYDRAFT_261464 [Fragilariopsis cylindrus CCMP1102]|uniref:Helicase-associated domain-containing protein n=1 Tax=Fragilariopsis cylindrus CCMP1102 TaxID=635003 RepID=A0A1E7FFW8_9STRA|nr:hypothetical protein FRACYDRAFT_261464 [Fragilariopsis cylindrus CCMP1102]|eukprot:OEU17036.1 hypothetical protein FRACYDRAFT_261464 [Fragilariopsis cylindrus CCMP1102]
MNNSIKSITQQRRHCVSATAAKQSQKRNKKEQNILSSNHQVSATASNHQVSATAAKQSQKRNKKEQNKKKNIKKQRVVKRVIKKMKNAKNTKNDDDKMVVVTHYKTPDNLVFPSSYVLPSLSSSLSSDYDSLLKTKSKTKTKTKTRSTLGYIRNWDTQYQSLVEFYHLNGHSSVLRSDPDKSLSGWVKRQRNNRKEGKLTQDQIDILDDVGFIWHRTNNAWNVKYNMLIDHFEKNGPCIVTCSTNRALAEWIQRQKREYRNSESKMSIERIDALERVFGWTWEK